MDSERTDLLDSGVGLQKKEKYELHEEGTNNDQTSNNEKQRKCMGESLRKGEKLKNKKRKKMKKKCGKQANGDALGSSATKQILSNFSKDEVRVEEEKDTTAILPSQYIDKKTEKGRLKRLPFPSIEKAPWLVFFSHGKGGKAHSICSMGDHKIYVRSIPQVARKKCGVCPLGWILLEDWDTKDVTLINPISMESIDLPPLPQLPKLNSPRIDRYRGHWSFQMTAPPTDKNSIIILTYCWFPYIIFCYPQEKIWYVRRCRIGQDDVCQEKMGFVRKCRLRDDDDSFISIAVVDGNIYGCTFARRHTKLIFNHCNFTIKCLDVKMPEDECLLSASFYRLIHSSGNLYMVMHFDKGFSVFKMNFAEMRWEEAENIGEKNAFLIGFNSEGVSCHVDETCLQKNCIYYVDGDNYLHQYKLEDKSITMLSYFPRLRLPENISPRWIVPQGKDSTNLDDSKLNLDVSQNLQEHIGPENNPAGDYKTSNIENSFTTLSVQPIQEIRASVIAAGRMSEGEGEGEGEGEIWLSLLPELVLNIIKHLSYLDSRCALLAIPQWGPAIRTIAKPIGTWYQDSPCLFSFPNDYRICTLIDPVRKVRHSIQSHGLPSKVRIVYAKHGWLLLRRPTGNNVFFYNPLSKAVINLPRLPEKFMSSLRFSFSTPPTSPDCVIVAYYLYPNSDQKILVCSRGENSWTQVLHEWEEDEVFMLGVTSGVFLKEKFHWLSINGLLGVLDPITRFWGINDTYKFEKPPDTSRSYLVESDDELFRVWVGKTGDSIRVHKLNYSSLTWHEVTSLEGRCFFLSQQASISISASVFEDKEERIYFPMLHNDRPVYYSYQTQGLVPSNSFYDANEFPFCCWIQPSWIQTTSEELQWF